MRFSKVLTVMGTRPEVIKLAPVVHELERRQDRFATVVCATGQHRSMLDQALALFQLSPRHDLNVMAPGQTLAEVTERVMAGLDRVLQDERPDVVLVQGDTTTAMCGALVAYYHRTPVGHVEAGLRTGDKYAPFPEEINRRLIDQIADYHFAPTDRAASALRDSGIADDQIFVTGNTVIDALLWMRDRLSDPPAEVGAALAARLIGDVVLVTCHRRESFGGDLEQICLGILDVVETFPQVTVVYPVHLNPNVMGPVTRLLGGHPRIVLTDPLGYEGFVWLMTRAMLVLTDSGGVQEEAPSLGKPVLVMREVTERREGIDAGNALLVGVGRRAIAEGVALVLRDTGRRAAMGRAANPYGDGHAAPRIVDVLERQAATRVAAAMPQRAPQEA